MKYAQKSNILQVPFAVLTISIILLSVFVQTLLQASLNDMKNDEVLSNAAVRQITLSQEILNSIAADNLAGNITNPPLDSLLREFYRGQKSLSNTRLSSSEAAPYLVQLRAVDSAYGNMSTIILANIGSDTDNTRKFLTLLDKQADYVRQLERYVAAIAGNSNAKVERFKEEELILTVFVLTIILLEVVFIFLPAIRKIKKQSEKFRQIAFSHSHIIRQPLANIKGLLEIVEDETLTGEAVEILRMMRDEADKLDDAIKTNIYNVTEK